MIVAILFIVAFILALLAAIGVAHPRFNLGWAAIAFMALALAISNGLMR